LAAFNNRGRGVSTSLLSDAFALLPHDRYFPYLSKPAVDVRAYTMGRKDSTNEEPFTKGSGEVEPDGLAG